MKANENSSLRCSGRILCVPARIWIGSGNCMRQGNVDLYVDVHNFLMYK